MTAKQDKEQQELGKSMYCLYRCAPELIRRLEERIRAIDEDMSRVQSVDYQSVRTTGSGATREEYLLRKIEQKDAIKRRIQALQKMHQMIREALDGLKEQEMTPYLLQCGSSKSVDVIGYELGYAGRTIYRKMDRWFAELSKEIVLH